MNSDDKTKKLSHIVIYADKKLSENPIWAFCTNIRSENPKIKVSYTSYDNRIGDDDMTDYGKYAGPADEDCGSVFFISDSEPAVSYMSKNGIASAALLTRYNRDRSFSCVLYCIEDMEYMTFMRIERMWMRYHHIPWTITQTRRLVIREQVLDDIDILYDIYSDREATMYTEDLYEDRAQEADYLQKYIDNQYRFYEYGIWALTLKDNGTLIGRAGISRREGYDLPELGYILGRQYRGMGYAKEALEAVIKYGTDEFGFDKYMAFTREKNVPSVRLLKSLGFTCTGHADISGHDHAMYTLKIGEPLTKT